MRLIQVREGAHVHWPDESPMRGRYRCGPGTVIDADGPCETFFLEGQEWKFHPAPEGSQPVPITDGDALSFLITQTGRAPEQPPSVAAVAQAARTASPASVDDIPEPSIPARAGTGATHATHAGTKRKGA